MTDEQKNNIPEDQQGPDQDRQQDDQIHEMTDADIEKLAEYEREKKEQSERINKEILDLLMQADPAALEETKKHIREQAKQDPAIAGKFVDALLQMEIIKSGEKWEAARQKIVEKLGGIEQAYANLINAVSNYNFQVNALPEIDPAVLQFRQELLDLLPYAEEELRKPEYGGISYGDLIEQAEKTGFDENTEIGAMFHKVRAAARAAKNGPALPDVSYKKITQLELSLDKLATEFFAPLAPPPAPDDIDGQMQFIPLPYNKKGSAKEIVLFYNYKYDDEVLDQRNIQKKIDDEDYFILSILWNCYTVGNTKLSITKLYRELNGDDPNQKQKEDFTNRLIKLATTSIYINDREVSTAWKRDTYHETVVQLAPIKIGIERFTTSGKEVDGGVIITDAPLIMQVSYQTNQFTTVPKELIQVKKKVGTKNGKPVYRNASRTNRLYRILHYLIRNIARAKDDETNPGEIDLIYDTLYTKTNEKRTTSSTRQARETMYMILDHFKNCEYITGYKEDQLKTGLGVRIYFKPIKKRTAKRLKSRK